VFLFNPFFLPNFFQPSSFPSLAILRFLSWEVLKPLCVERSMKGSCPSPSQIFPWWANIPPPYAGPSSLHFADSPPPHVPKLPAPGETVGIRKIPPLLPPQDFHSLFMNRFPLWLAPFFLLRGGFFPKLVRDDPAFSGA